MTRSASDAPTWWIRPGLEPVDGRLRIAGRDAASLAREHGTPVYVYDVAHIVEQVRAVQAALAATGVPHRMRFALKSQRQPEILAVLRGLGEPGTPASIGMDVCSPGEAEHVLAHGWRPEEISHTGTNVSDDDFRRILAQPMQINVDLLTQLERIGRLAPGRKVGIRINPRAGAARPYVPAGHAEDGEPVRFGQYAGEKPTKFGIYAEQLDEAIAIATRHELQINVVHFHLCHQTLTSELPKLDNALDEAMKMARHLIEAGCPIEEVNTGGGIGTPLHQGDEPLDLEAWAALLAKHVAPLDVTLATEPGEFFVSGSGVLLAEVVTVEDRLSTPFVGLNVGYNNAPRRFVWGEWMEIVPCAAPAAPRTQTVTVSGHINEAPDLFAEDYPFPAVNEGDTVAFMNVGSYCQATASRHCMRPPAPSVFLYDRLPA